ncbi:MAG: right-handed parallel beta-helix repeat-containing protein [Promethearchaeota archaeon]
MLSKKNCLSKFMWGILIIVIVSTIFISTQKYDNKNLTHPKVAESSITHPKIIINGNAALLSFPNKTGSGIENDPFVISDITIDAEGNGSCIEINDTSYFLHLDQITVSNAGPDGGWEESDFDAGIELRNCTNVRISGSISEDSYWGIVVRDCTDCVITNTLILQNEMVGIFVDEISQSRNLKFQQNQFEENFIGMWMRGGDGFSIVENGFSSSKFGPRLEILQVENSTIRNNDFDSETNGECLEVLDSHNNLIQDNTFKNSLSALAAMYLWSSNDNLISYNTFLSNTKGIWLQYSNNNEISKNIFKDGVTGISLESSSFNYILKNQFKRIDTIYEETLCFGNVFKKYINWWAIIIGAVVGIGALTGGFFVIKAYKKRPRTPKVKSDSKIQKKQIISKQNEEGFPCPHCGQFLRSRNINHCVYCGASLK